MVDQAHITSFPLWIIITHFLNIIFITFLMRSGLQILSDHPRLYWNDHCSPGTEWLRFTKKSVPTDRYYPSIEDCVAFSPFMALPGGKHLLGLGRNIHFFCAFFWILNGLTYVILLCTTGLWPRLIPTSWDCLPRAFETFLTYASFHIPPLAEFQPYDALQQLSYAVIVFIIAPLQILTGCALSPAIAARFPWYPRLFGGRQAARSLHFILLCTFVAFLVIHIIMVLLVRFPLNMAHMVLGTESHQTLAIVIGGLALFGVVLLHWIITRICRTNPRSVQNVTCALIQPLFKALLSHLHSHQKYGKESLSPYFWRNGIFCADEEWKRLETKEFADWKLKVTGCIERPLTLSLDDLRALPKAIQTTEHCCIQGWSGFAEWGGVRVEEILTLCRPLPQARYLVFSSYQTDEKGIPYYEVIEIERSKDPQTILAYEMNGHILSSAHGAPLRLRVENVLGYKMTKWIKSMEIIADLSEVGLGYGGYHEDYEYYSMRAEI